MIHLDQGQAVAEHPELIVYDPTGDYNDNDMVLCAKIDDAGEPYCRFEAQFIAYGGVVYSISDDTQLSAAIDQMDPGNTLNDAADNSPVTTDPEAPDSTTTDDLIVPPPETTPATVQNDPVPPPVDTTTSTTTPTTLPEATSTPPELPDLTAPDASSTPPLDTGTTTATSTTP